MNGMYFVFSVMFCVKSLDESLEFLATEVQLHVHWLYYSAVLW